MAPKGKKSNGNSHDELKWPYGRKNYLFFALALVVIVIGFISLAQGSITLAPILLVVGYCVLLPIALIVKGHPEEEDTPQTE